MSGLRRGAMIAAMWVGTVALAIGAVGQQEEAFPHADHDGLFPVCTGCHQGVESGEAEATYPEAALCARCHDGEQEDSVAWLGPERASTNVQYDHVEHATSLRQEGDPVQSCESCHSDADSRMSVGPEEQLETCFSCHAHQTDDHYALGECVDCHVPLAETSFEEGRVTALPVPDDHDSGLFLLELHGASYEQQRCATCHTVERCASCHVDASIPEIQRIPAAGPDLELPTMPAAYPVPASHVDEGWLSSHPTQAPVGECSTCHTQNDCTECHVGEPPREAAALPTRDEVSAPGVRLLRRAPEHHESPFFVEGHGTLAETQETSCASCHTEAQCVECHDGPVGGGYHPPDFVSRHSADAFGRSEECASCHNSAAFCRECHQSSGPGVRGRLGGGYHDAEPLWLLRHGGAARQSLETCASCHEQNDCVQCHGVLGAFKVSPHGPSFDAEAAWRRNPRSCMACHVGNPIGGEDP